MSESVDVSRHRNQFPRDIHFHEHAGEVLCTYVNDHASPALYEVVGQTQNPRVLTLHDRAVVSGTLVSVSWNDETGVIETCHPYAGRKDSYIPEHDWLESPALLLERLDTAGSVGEVDENVD